MPSRLPSLLRYRLASDSVSGLLPSLRMTDLLSTDSLFTLILTMIAYSWIRRTNLTVARTSIPMPWHILTVAAYLVPALLDVSITRPLLSVGCICTIVY